MTKLIVNNNTNGVIPNYRALAVVSQTMQQNLAEPPLDSTGARLEDEVVSKNNPTEYTVELDK